MVDVVELSSRFNRSSTERMAPPCSAHIHLGEVFRLLDPAEGEVVDEFRQHDNVLMVMVM